MQNSEQSHSLQKAKIKFLLLEGIHPRAREVLENAGYTNIVEQAGALTPEDLHKALKGVHFVGIRSRTQLDAAAIDVFPVEPKSNDDRFESPLVGLDNVLITPHIGGSTLEAQENIAVEVASKLVRYSDNGTTRSAVNFPQVSLPDHGDTRRIMHIHHNEPGVLQSINQVFFDKQVNIAAQYLQTDGDIGYFVMDVESDQISGLMEELAKIPATIRTRKLH